MYGFILLLRLPFKLVVVIALSLVLSCVTAPGVRTDEVAELNYGDREELVVEKLGQGSEVFYFVLDGNQYRYRLYKTIYTENVYALLFLDGGLTAVHDARVTFSECLIIDENTSWEQCLSDNLSEMRFHVINLDSHDFSHGVKAEQAERDRARGKAVAIAVPLTVVYPWVVATVCVFSCGACVNDLDQISSILDPGAKSGDYLGPCTDSLASTLSQAISIIHGKITYESMDKSLGRIRHKKSIFSAGRSKIINNNYAIHFYSWGCIDSDVYLNIRLGLTNRQLKWAWFRYESQSTHNRLPEPKEPLINLSLRGTQ